MLGPALYLYPWPLACAFVLYSWISYPVVHFACHGMNLYSEGRHVDEAARTPLRFERKGSSYVQQADPT